MKRNPYSMVFGKKPPQIVSRIAQTDEIRQTFLEDPPSQQVYIITGVRGAGKTVLMNAIARAMSEEKDWVVVELNPARDMLQSFAAKLYGTQGLTNIFKKAKLNLSLFGIGVEISGVDPIPDIELAIERMLESIQNHNKKVLICIDEAANTEYMKVFASAFQIFIRHDYPLFLLMTGLYDNIEALQNDKILTFLHRAPKVRLAPLNTGRIAAHYQKTFHLSDGDAREMARLTRGYPFAFQVLGHYTFENEGDFRKAQDETRQYLEEYAYDKIWSELSRKDRTVLYGMAKTTSGNVAEIREFLHLGSNEFSTYRDRLIKKGIINGEERGFVSFMLPFFEAYVLDHADIA